VIIDGKEIEVLNDVKVIHEDQMTEWEGNPVNGQLHLTMTHEGMIADFYEEKDECYLTQAFDLETITEMLI
jgi:hypothetical protein